MGNTPFVLVMLAGGISPRRAEAFERLLDDARFCGIGSDLLYRIIARHAESQVYVDRQVKEGKQVGVVPSLQNQLDLYESSAYGTHVVRGPHRG